MRSESELVEANSKLGVIAGLTGFVAIIPAALLQVTPLRGWGTLLYSGALFALRAGERHAPAGRRRRGGSRPQAVERVQLHPAPLQLAAVAMMMLRAAVGFVFFHLAFWLRTQSAGHGLVRGGRRAVGARHDGRQRRRATAAARACARS